MALRALCFRNRINILQHGILYKAGTSWNSEKMIVQNTDIVKYIAVAFYARYAFLKTSLNSRLIFQ